MEDEKRRWSVTYTKHLKQKRKVYQDGFLDLHSSTNKLMLYDELEKLLECRILRHDEVVSSDQTLTFSAHLVDVGLLHAADSHSDAISKSHKARAIKPSPSQKIIREFKKSEVQKYGPPQASPTTMKSTVTEWHVLYTTQRTQKSKKYHDGFLQLSVCGTLQNKVMLFDEQRKLLESKFLKSDMVIRSGESISLGDHLVDIGECKGNTVQGNDSIVEQKNQFVSSKEFGKDDKKSVGQMFGGGHSTECANKSHITEWQVMYTAQVTKRAKTYHDGFLRLRNSGTLQRQIILYDESKKVIDSRFLKKDEVIKSGESIAFDAHLVDIGEPEVDLMDSDFHVSCYNVDGKTGLKHSTRNFLKINKSFLKGKPQNNAYSRVHADPGLGSSKIDETKLSHFVSVKKPLRDAIQILSVLQKPMMQDNIASRSTDMNIKNPVSSVIEPRKSDSTRNIPECNQLPKTPVEHHRSSKRQDNRGSSEWIDFKTVVDLYPKAKFSCNGDKSSKKCEEENSHQPHSNNTGAYTEDRNEASVLGCSSPIILASEEKVELKNSLQVNTSIEASMCPSFELGFD